MVRAGYSHNSTRSYSAGFKRYIKFCNVYLLDPLHVSEVTVLRFVAYMASHQLMPATIRVYLAAVRSWFVTSGLPIPEFYTPRVKLAIKSIERDTPPPSQVLPLTYALLSRVFDCFSPSLDNLMCFSAMALAYYACLRAAE